jgi:DNA transposition AAA+ family ATPase
MESIALTDTIARARHYMAVADMDTPQFARLCGRSLAAVQSVLNGTYPASDTRIREAMELAMRQNPVGQVAVACEGKLYETENVAQIRAIFDHCHRYQSMAYVYGPPGSQKTFVLEQLVAAFNRREQGLGSKNYAFYVRASIGIRPRDLVAKICKAVGAHVGRTLQTCMNSLRDRLRNTRTVIVLDEAQLCGIEALEALRELQETDTGFGLLFAGSHRLKQFFDQHAAELEQFNSRIDAGIELQGISPACARAILAAECPGIADDEIDTIVAEATTRDIYSRDASRTYLSVRRIFRSITAIKRLEAEAEGATV